MKSKKIINVSECVPGMVVAEPVFNNFGSVIIWENSIFDKNAIEMLKRIGLENVSIYLEDEQIASTQEAIGKKSNDSAIALYENNISSIKTFTSDLINGKFVRTETIEAISEELFKQINNNSDVIRCMNLNKSSSEYDYVHSINVAYLCMMLGKWLKYDSDSIKKLILAGLLHDIGKTKVPRELLYKHGRVTESEKVEIQRHSQYGYVILRENGHFDEDIRQGVLFHHERNDGTGYPFGMEGSKINVISKIIAVADVYDAMTANKIYGEKVSQFHVFRFMSDGSFGHFDPVIVSTFLKNIAAYYIGCMVILNNGEMAEVVHINERNVAKPIVYNGKKYIDLSFSSDLSISKLCE